MPQYATKQRKAMLAYFQAHIDEPVSAQQIAEGLADANISVSAIYRNLAALEKDGKLQRVSQSDSRETYYRYKAFDQCKDCLHLSCKKCGKTFHLGHQGVSAIERALTDGENFLLDKSDTILYGVCEKCRK